MSFPKISAHIRFTAIKKCFDKRLRWLPELLIAPTHTAEYNLRIDALW